MLTIALTYNVHVPGSDRIFTESLQSHSETSLKQESKHNHHLRKHKLVLSGTYEHREATRHEMARHEVTHHEMACHEVAHHGGS